MEEILREKASVWNEWMTSKCEISERGTESSSELQDTRERETQSINRKTWPDTSSTSWQRGSKEVIRCWRKYSDPLNKCPKVLITSPVSELWFCVSVLKHQCSSSIYIQLASSVHPAAAHWSDASTRPPYWYREAVPHDACKGRKAGDLSRTETITVKCHTCFYTKFSVSTNLFSQFTSK